MTADRLTARERFVEVAKSLHGLYDGDGVPGRNRTDTCNDTWACVKLRQAVDAFADAECGRPYTEHPEFAHGGVDSTPDGSGRSWSKAHATCRAALLKEVGLHGSERSDE